MKHFFNPFYKWACPLFPALGPDRSKQILVRLLFVLLLLGSSVFPLFAKPANAYLNLAEPATEMNESGFTANWSEPPGASIDRFILDISTSPTFATFVTGYQAKNVINFSIEVTGLAPVTTYYYRVRYVETGNTQPSAYSNVISVTTLMRNFLSDLSFKDSDQALLPVFPVFNKNVTSYTLDTDVNTLTVTPAALDAYSTISCAINGGSQTVITNLVTAVSFNLSPGQNSIALKVSSSDLAFKIYYIQVNVITPLIITSIDPVKAAPGSAVIISGSRFNATPSENVVFFGTAKGTVTAASSTSLTVIVPNGASNSPVTVVNKETASTGYSKKFFFPTARTYKPTFVLSDFSARVDVPIPSQSFQRADIMDVNNDTRPDIIWTKGGDKTAVLLNNSTLGGLAFQSTSNDFNHISQARVKAGDINGDGKPDIIASTDRSVLFNTTVNNYMGSYVSFETYDSGKDDVLSSELIQDIDGDGRPDVIATGHNTAVIRRNMTAGNITAFGNPQEFFFRCQRICNR